MPREVGRRASFCTGLPCLLALPFRQCFKCRVSNSLLSYQDLQPPATVCPTPETVCPSVLAPAVLSSTCTPFTPSHQHCRQIQGIYILRGVPKTLEPTQTSHGYFRCYDLYLYRDISGPLKLFDTHIRSILGFIKLCKKIAQILGYYCVKRMLLL